MFEILLLNMDLPVEEVVSLDEPNSDHYNVFIMVNSSMKDQILRNMFHSVRWDEFRQYLKPIKFSSDNFSSTNALEIVIKAFSNTLSWFMSRSFIHLPSPAGGSTTVLVSFR